MGRGRGGFEAGSQGADDLFYGLLCWACLIFCPFILAILAVWIYSVVYYTKQVNVDDATCMVVSTLINGPACQISLTYTNPDTSAALSSVFSDDTDAYCAKYVVNATIPCFIKSSNSSVVLLSKPVPTYKARTFLITMSVFASLVVCGFCCACGVFFEVWKWCDGDCCRCRCLRRGPTPAQLQHWRQQEHIQQQVVQRQREEAAARRRQVQENERRAREIQVAQQQRTRQERMYDLIWSNAFVAAKQEALMQYTLHVLKLEDFETLEPFLIIGLPGVVIMMASLRSAIDHRVVNGVALTDGTIVTHANRPRLGPGVEIFEGMLALNKMVAAASLHYVETEYLKQFVLLGNNPERTTVPVYAEGDRLIELHGIAAAANGIAIRATQLPRFQEQFQNTVEEIIAEIKRRQSEVPPSQG